MGSLIVAFVFLCVAVMVLGVASGKPYGWIALGLAVIALLIAAVGGLSVHVGSRADARLPARAYVPI